jgi:hypothetical protein
MRTESADQAPKLTATCTFPWNFGAHISTIPLGDATFDISPNLLINSLKTKVEAYANSIC